MLLFALTLLAGCSADVTAPFPESQALLVGTLVVETHPSLQGPAVAGIEFSGRFDPGRDPQGALRRVQSGAFTLLDREIEPVGTEGAGIRLYRTTWEEVWGEGTSGSGAGREEGGLLPADVRGWTRPLEIRPPTVGGLPATTEAFRFGACAAHRSSEAAVVVRVQCDGSFSRPVHVGWRLTVRSPENGAVVLRLEGDRPPPSLIQVPGAWLPERSLPWAVELEITQRYGWSLAGGTYRTNLVVRWRNLWPPGS